MAIDFGFTKFVDGPGAPKGQRARGPSPVVSPDRNATGLRPFADYVNGSHLLAYDLIRLFSSYTFLCVILSRCLFVLFLCVLGQTRGLLSHSKEIPSSGVPGPFPGFVFNAK